MSAGAVGPEDLAVRGGVGGVAAAYERVLGLADAYDDLGDRLRARARAVLGTTADPGLVASAVISPVSLARAEAALVTAAAGPDGLGVCAAGWEADAVAVRACVAGLRATDDAVAGAVGSLAYRAGALAGPSVLGAGLVGAAGIAGSPAAWPAVATLAAAYGGPAGLARRLDALAVEDPWLVEPSVMAAAGALDAVSGTPLPGPWVGALLGDPGVDGAAGRLAAAYGAEGSAVFRPRPDLAPATVAPPRTVADLLAGLASTATLARDTPGTIAVETLVAADGSRSHVVHLPGTDDMATMPWTRDDDVRDLGTNLRLLAGPSGGPTTYGDGVLAAMAAAGVRPDEPVLLTGHSQGGMQAVALAAAGADTPYDLRQVVTAGAPTAQVPELAPGVAVLSLENRGDPVPLLDGAPNPDTPQRVTVAFDSPDDDARPDGVRDRHALRHYADAAAAVDASDDPSLLAQRDRMTDLGFLGAERAELRVFRLSR